MRLRGALALVGLAVVPARVDATDPVDGTWHLAGRVTATACADRCVTHRQRIDDQITVTNGQLTGGEGLVPACDPGSISETEFDGLATLVPVRRGWQRIRIVDRPRFVQLMRRCIGYPSLRLGRIAGRVKVAPDAQHFRERVFVSGSVSVYGRTATFSANGRVRAAWTGDAGVPLGTLRAAALVRALRATLPAE